MITQQAPDPVLDGTRLVIPHSEYVTLTARITRALRQELGKAISVKEAHKQARAVVAEFYICQDEVG